MESGSLDGCEETGSGGGGDGRDGLVAEVSFGGDGVEPLADVVGLSDFSDAVSVADFLADNAVDREESQSVRSEHFHLGAVVELRKDAGADGLMVEPFIQGPAQGGVIGGEEGVGSVERTGEVDFSRLAISGAATNVMPHSPSRWLTTRPL